MYSDPQYIALNAQNALQTFQGWLNKRLLEFHQEGLLKDIEKAKIEQERDLTSEALQSAFTKEWPDSTMLAAQVSAFVNNYTNGVRKELRTIEARRYTDKAIIARLNRTKDLVITTMRAWEVTPQTMRRKAHIKHSLEVMESVLWRDIKCVREKHSKWLTLVEASLQDFESESKLLLSDDPLPNSVVFSH